MEHIALEGASTFLGDLALVLAVAAVTGIACRRLRQPVVLGYLLTGLVVGPYIPIPLFADPGRVEALAEFGVVLVMFSVGLEFSFRRLAGVLPRAGLPALVQISTLGWLGMLMARVLGWGEIEGVFLGACFAISSTMVVVRAIAEVPVSRPARDLAIGILVIQDLAAILAIAGLTGVVSGEAGGTQTLTATASGLTLFLLGIVVVGLLLVPRAVRHLARIGNQEMLVVAVTGFCFGLALVAKQMGYSVALGAFVAGSLVAESGEGHRIQGLIRPMRDLFAAVFFVAVGMAVDPRLLAGVAPYGLLAAALVVLGQLFSVGVGGTLAGRGLSTALRAGAALGQIGEFSFILAALGVSSGAVRPELASIVVLTALLTTFTTPIALRQAERLGASLDRRIPAGVRRLLTLYPSWLEALAQRARETRRKTPWRRLVLALALDVAILIALTHLTVAGHHRLAETLARQTALPQVWSHAMIVAGAVLLAAPFAVGLVRTGRRLGLELGEAALPSAEGRLDRAAAPRTAMTALLQIAVVAAAASVYVTATQPVLPAGWGVAVLAVTGLGLVWAFRRTSASLDGHVRAGAEALAEALLQRDAASRPFEALSELLPGLGDLTALRIEPNSGGAGRSLAELDLRGRTGATVLALRRGEAVHVLPGAPWRLEPGDLLGLTGSHEAVEQAAELLRRPAEKG